MSLRPSNCILILIKYLKFLIFTNLNCIMPCLTVLCVAKRFLRIKYNRSVLGRERVILPR